MSKPHMVVAERTSDDFGILFGPDVPPIRSCHFRRGGLPARSRDHPPASYSRLLSRKMPTGFCLPAPHLARASLRSVWTDEDLVLGLLRFTMRLAAANGSSERAVWAVRVVPQWHQH